MQHVHVALRVRMYGKMEQNTKRLTKLEVYDNVMHIFETSQRQDQWQVCV